MDKNFIFTKELKILFNVLNKKDELRLVGGCVRNFLLNKPINDYDLATKHQPKTTMKLLKENGITVIPTGIKHGTITAVINGINFEITTLRKDVDTDGRHSFVEFIDSYLEDAKRRDLTFNALYLDYNGKIFDYLDGLNDLKKGIVKFIGNAENRVKEDYLRILRFFRFYSNYGKILDKNSLEACVKYKNYIKKLSRERIKEEFFKILNSEKFLEVLNLMKEFGFLEYIFGSNNINLDNLKNFSKIKNIYNFVNIFPLLLILSTNRNITDFKKIFILTKKENFFLQTVLNNLFYDLNEKNIKVLLFLLKDKELIKNIIFVKCINVNLLGDIDFYLNILDNLKEIIFPIKAKDLIGIGFTDKSEFNFLLEKAKNIFIDYNFEISKEELLEKMYEQYPKSLDYNF